MKAFSTRMLFCFAVLSTATVATLVTPHDAVAQDKTGDLRGTVTDDHQQPVIGARVSIAKPDRVSLTDERGRYVLRGLPAGSYSVAISAIGRKTLIEKATVAAGTANTFDAKLADGSLLLSGVVVSATRTSVDANKVASTVNVLTPEQVRQSPARESQDLLREIPAVELPRTSSLVGGTAQIVSIRGVDEGRTAVLFDGVPVNDAWGEWIDWGRVPKNMLDRVEVVEGGSSSLYGNGAMGGIISFFSRPMAPNSARIQLDGGSRNARHAFVAAGSPVFHGLSATVSGDYQENGGYVLIDSAIHAPGVYGLRGPVDVASNVIQRNAYARVNYAPSANWSAFATGHFFGDSRTLGTPLAFANRDQRNVDVGFDYGTVSHGQLTLRAWDGRQIENQRASNIRSVVLRTIEDSSLTANIPSHDWGASAIWTRAGLPGLESFSVGGDFRHYQGDYNEIDFNTTCPGTNCGAFARQISSGGAQSLSGAFAQAIAAPFDPLRIELSARVDQWSNNDGHSNDAAAGPTTYPDKSKTSFSPRVGVHYQLHPTFSLRGAVYKAFRAPNLAELYRKQISATSITIPNPDLKAETALGREVGFDWQPAFWLQAKGTYYVADYNDFNVPVTLTGTDRLAACGTITTCRQRLNVTATRSEGIEGYVALRPISQLLISAGVNYDDARQQSALTAAQLSSKPHINRVPSPRQTVRGTYSSGLLGEATVIWRHEGQTTTLGGLPLRPFTVVDLNYRREIVRGLSGFVSVENVGDVRFQVNKAGAGTAASPFIITTGLPRTVRAGLEAFRF
ncbi:MAG: TonB-dependent receptor [Gemmatimonadaceae bacterium]